MPDLLPAEIDNKPTLLLGTDLMETFRKVALDFHDRKLWFQLRHGNDGWRRQSFGPAGYLASNLRYLGFRR